MVSDRDHEENACFRDRSQEGAASMSDMGTVANGIPSALPAWEEWLDRTSTEQILILRENNRKKALRTRRKRRLLRACRFVLPAVATAMIVFLCVAPMGRAFANAAIHNITEMVGHFFYLQSADGGVFPASVEGDAVPSVTPGGFDKIKAASQRAKESLLYIAEKGLVVSDVSVGTDDDTTTVQIEYRTQENDSIVTRQVITKGQSGWGGTLDVDGTAPQTHRLYNGEILYYSYTRDGFAVGSARWGDITFIISSATLKWEKLLEFVDALTRVQ